mmetsp:Transcript_33534/g.54010  ORF Transcript_33534/g.54010 Transcript_33534/m.54010 type:complete len:312 (-) Transcript_33534:246-1181(-)
MVAIDFRWGCILLASCVSYVLDLSRTAGRDFPSSLSESFPPGRWMEEREGISREPSDCVRLLSCVTSTRSDVSTFSSFRTRALSLSFWISIFCRARLALCNASCKCISFECLLAGFFFCAFSFPVSLATFVSRISACFLALTHSLRAALASASRAAYFFSISSSFLVAPASSRSFAHFAESLAFFDSNARIASLFCFASSLNCFFISSILSTAFASLSCVSCCRRRYLSSIASFSAEKRASNARNASCTSSLSFCLLAFEAARSFLSSSSFFVRLSSFWSICTRSAAASLFNLSASPCALLIRSSRSAHRW